MEHGKRYLVLMKHQDRRVIKLAYWFNERNENNWTYKAGFYPSPFYINPCQNVIGYKEIPDLVTWGRNKVPVENEKYLAYRIGTSWIDDTPHYAIKKFHNGDFPNKDVKYWISLKEIDFGWHEYKGE